MRTVARIHPLPVLPAVFVMLVAFATGCSDDEGFTDSTRTIFGSGTIVEETREVSGFTRISHEAVGEIIVTLGQEEGLRIETDDNLLAEIVTEVKNGVLTIRRREDVSLRPTDTITYHLDAISLTGITISGAGSVEAAGLSAETLALTVIGVGDLLLADVDAASLDLTISGVGNVSLAGTATALDIVVSGTGEVRARSLQSTEAVVVVTGVATMALQVSETLGITITGQATICYDGEPAVATNIEGSGTVGPCGGE